jgi:3-(3-hydroxy-phenyl)propionate hydroxylase
MRQYHRPPPGRRPLTLRDHDRAAFRAGSASRMRPDHPIIIAGGGPVGVITALALARQGLAVAVFEAEACVNDSPRAATTHAATLAMLEDLGLLDEVIRRGLIERKFRIWDRGSREIIAEFDFGMLGEDTRFPYVVQCEQHKLARIALDRLRSFPAATVQFSSRVTALQQHDDRIDVEVETAGGTKWITGSYLIGCDGGRSTVRKALDIEFAGYTHPERFLILTTTFGFDAEYGQCSRNYFSDPEEWCALFKVTGDDGKGLWRLLFPTAPDAAEAEVMSDAAVQRRLQSFFPRPGAYPVVHRNLYNVHQRVAAAFRKGRVFLAGDAAHVNNPLGGLGLNFGIHDAIELGDLLGRVIREEASPDILDAYDRYRRPLNIEYVQQQTIANKKRLEEKDPQVRARSNAALRATAADPAAHRAYLLRASLIEAVRRRQAAALRARPTGGPAAAAELERG